MNWLKFQLPSCVNFVKKEGGMKFQLTNVHLTVVGVNDPEYQFQFQSRSFPNGTTILLGGANVEIFYLLQTSLNFTYSVIAGEGWISQAPNGSLLGIGRQVLQGEANLSITPALLAPYRIAAFSFLNPLSIDKVVVALRQPATFSLDAVYATFPVTFWAISVVLVLLSLLFLKLVERQLKAQPLLREENGDGVLLHRPYFWMIAIFTQQGIAAMPSVTSARVVYLFIMLATIITCAAFNGSLVSTLAVGTIPIKSFGDLVKSNLVIMGDKGIKGLREHPGVEKRIGGYSDVASGVRFVEEGKGAFVTLRNTIFNGYKTANVSQQTVCTELFHFVAARSFPSAMFVPKNSEIKEPLSVTLATFRERGYVTRLNWKWESIVIPLCNKYVTRNKVKSMTFHDVLRVFQALTIGIGASGVVLILENRRNKRRRGC